MMDWTQTIFMLTAIIGTMHWFTSKISKDIDKMDTDIKEQGQRIDQQGQRIDRLYTMFIDLLKEGRK